MVWKGLEGPHRGRTAVCLSAHRTWYCSLGAARGSKGLGAASCLLCPKQQERGHLGKHSCVFSVSEVRQWLFARSHGQRSRGKAGRAQALICCRPPAPRDVAGAGMSLLCVCPPADGVPPQPDAWPGARFCAAVPCHLCAPCHSRGPAAFLSAIPSLPRRGPNHKAISRAAPSGGGRLAQPQGRSSWCQQTSRRVPVITAAGVHHNRASVPRTAT